jgi:hypothetical protein
MKEARQRGLSVTVGLRKKEGPSAIDVDLLDYRIKSLARAVARAWVQRALARRPYGGGPALSPGVNRTKR